MLKVFLLEEIQAELIALLKNKLSNGIELVTGKNIPSPADYHILIAGVPERKYLEAGHKLHTLIIPWVGLPQRTAKLLEDFPDIKIYNIHHNAETTAEMAVTLMLTSAKRIIPIDKDFRKGDWTRRYNPEPILLMKDKTALVMGFGAIGKHIARICTGMGMNVLAVRRSTTDEPNNIYNIERLHELLPQSQFLFVAVPHTPETKGIISSTELKLLPDNCIIVNIARGAVIDEKALFDELSSGRIRAGLDVWYNYPEHKEDYKNTFPSDYPFHTLDNVVITPHLAGHSDLTEILRIEKLAELLNNIASGKETENRIYPERGY